jgi:hypothetical protein
MAESLFLRLLLVYEVIIETRFGILRLLMN